MSIDQKVLHAYVALENLGKGRAINEIAIEVGKSRFAVARMVQRARELGLVEVRATVPELVDVQMSAELANRYGLEAALVVATHAADVAEARRAIAEVTARFIVDVVQEDDILGLAPGRTLVEASRLIDTLPTADVVQLTGTATPRLEDGVEVIANLGRAAGGGTHPLFLPMVLPRDPEARAILAHPSIQRTLRRLNSLQKVFLTIGGWPDASLLAGQLQELGERDEYDAKGAVAEIGTMLLDENGKKVPGLGRRLVGIDEAQLRSVRMRAAIGGGIGKEAAVLATLRSGLATHLITDIRCARAALEA